MKLKSLLIVGLMVVATIGAVGAAQAEDARLFVRHEVADYGVWRKAFNAFLRRVARTQGSHGKGGREGHAANLDHNEEHEVTHQTDKRAGRDQASLTPARLDFRCLHSLNWAPKKKPSLVADR